MRQITRIKDRSPEMIEIDLYDYWKDGNAWKVSTIAGIMTFKTKAKAYQFAVDAMSAKF